MEVLYMVKYFWSIEISQLPMSKGKCAELSLDWPGVVTHFEEICRFFWP